MRTLNRSTERRKKNLLKLLNGGGARAESGPNKLTQRPTLKQKRSSTAAAELEALGRRKGDDDAKRHGGK